jgi:hypothetical protein
VGGYIDTSAVNATRTALIANGLVSVRQYGAVGDGVTDDTNAINAAIQANPGRTIYFPSKTYLIDAAANVGQRSSMAGLKLNLPGTKLLLDAGAVLQVATTAAGRYSVVEVSAADCVIEGGHFRGDLDTHLGSTDEHGYGILVNSGADRCVISNVRASKMWGDGIMVGDGDSYVDGNVPTDVRILNVVCTDNRRQGLSVVGSRRLRVIGGTFAQTGTTVYTAPGAGIDFEPSPDGLQDNFNFEVIGATAHNNVGRGFVTQGNGRTNSGRFLGCTARSNDGEGFAIVSSTDRVELNSCSAISNTLEGFLLVSTSVNSELKACTADLNLGQGFKDDGTGNQMTACHAKNNAKAGFYVGASAVGTRLVACSTAGNCTSGGFWVREYELYAVGTHLSGCHATVGTNATKPTTGFQIRTGATTVTLVGCSASGTWSAAAFAGQADTIANPVPGFVVGFTGATTGTTAPTAGGAGALPATPLGYVTVHINGTSRKMPYYA